LKLHNSINELLLISLINIIITLYSSFQVLQNQSSKKTESAVSVCN